MACFLTSFDETHVLLAKKMLMISKKIRAIPYVSKGFYECIETIKKV